MCSHQAINTHSFSRLLLERFLLFFLFQCLSHLHHTRGLEVRRGGRKGEEEGEGRREGRREERGGERGGEGEMRDESEHTSAIQLRGPQSVP